MGNNFNTFIDIKRMLLKKSTLKMVGLGMPALLSIIVLVLGCSCMKGCKSKTKDSIDGCRETQGGLLERDTREIVLRGSKKYHQKINNFSITSSRDAAIILTNKEGKPLVGYRHYLLWGNGYVFSLVRKDAINLNGYYVDGMTGKVRRIEGQRPIYPIDLKKNFSKEAIDHCYELANQ